MAREIQEKTAFRQECTFGRKTLYSPSILHSVRNVTIAEGRIPNGMRGIERAVCFYRTIMPTALSFNSKGRKAILRTTFTTPNNTEYSQEIQAYRGLLRSNLDIWFRDCRGCRFYPRAVQQQFDALASPNPKGRSP